MERTDPDAAGTQAQITWNLWTVLLALCVFLLLSWLGVLGCIALYKVVEGRRHQWALDHPRNSFTAVRVENAGGSGRYQEGARCLINWTASFVPMGDLGGEPIMRYQPKRPLAKAECPDGTLVQVSEAMVAAERAAIVREETLTRERAALTERSKRLAR
jgi:hypothetical protein